MSKILFKIFKVCKIQFITHNNKLKYRFYLSTHNLPKIDNSIKIYKFPDGLQLNYFKILCKLRENKTISFWISVMNFDITNFSEGYPRYIGYMRDSIL